MYFARSPEPNFHPEFGFMCPSSTFRRVVRVAIVSIVFGATVGAIAVFALVPRSGLAGGDKALNIIFADQAAAANGAPAATTGANRVQIASHKPAQGNLAANLVTNAESAAAADTEEPKVAPKKKKKKVAQSRSRRRDAEVADTRDPGAFATPFGSRVEPRRDSGRTW